MEQTIPDHHQTLLMEKWSMKWSKYSMCVAKAEGARYITMSSGEDFP